MRHGNNIYRSIIKLCMKASIYYLTIDLAAAAEQQQKKERFFILIKRSDGRMLGTKSIG